MRGKNKEYTRLPGRGRTTVNVVHAVRYSLWLGPNHILAIANEGFSEDYKRFYYKDIQALVIQKTIAGAIYNAILAFIMALFFTLAAIGIAKKWDSGGIVTLCSFAGFFLVLLAVNLIKGPTCKCFLQTAVQTEQLYSLRRIRTARKTIARIKQAVEAVQGSLSAEHLASAPSPSAVFQTTAPVTRAPDGRLIPHKHYNGRFHLWLFSFLLVNALAYGLCIVVFGAFAGIVCMMVNSCCTILTIVALVKQNDTDLGSDIKTITWTTLGYIVASYIFIWTYSAIAGFQAAIDGTPHSEISPWGIFTDKTSITVVFRIVSAACNAALGIFGLKRMDEFRKRAGMPPPIRSAETQKQAQPGGGL